MSLSRELIVAAKARADTALHFDGHPDDWDDVAYGSVKDVPVMADALLRVLDLHHRVMNDRRNGWLGDPYESCRVCHMGWPCATVRAVTGDTIGP